MVLKRRWQRRVEKTNVSDPDIREALVDALKANQFASGDIKGQFGTNTDFGSRPSYHLGSPENMALTPQMFLTYAGVLSLQYINRTDLAAHTSWAVAFTRSCLRDGLVRIASPFQAPDRDDGHSSGGINYRHSAMAHALLTTASDAHDESQQFIRALYEMKPQTKCGGWPESSLQRERADIKASVYMAHFLFQYQRKYPHDACEAIVKRLLESTMGYLSLEYGRHGWLEEECPDDPDASKRFYPTLYLLAYPVYLHLQGKDCPVIAEYPGLMRFLSDRDHWIGLRDPRKVYRTTLRYVTNLYFNSFLSGENHDLYLQYREPILAELQAHYHELNTHEILGAYVMVDSVDQESAPLRKPFRPYFETNRLQASVLMDQLANTEPGIEAFQKYQHVIRRIFEFIYDGVLGECSPEQPVGGGTQRIDLVFSVDAQAGFFANLSARFGVRCSYLLIECKNNRENLDSESFDQITGRLGFGHGDFGILACRRKPDKQLLAERYKHLRASKQSVMMLVLDDNDIRAMLKAKAQGSTALDAIMERLVQTVTF